MGIVVSLLLSFPARFLSDSRVVHIYTHDGWSTRSFEVLPYDPSSEVSINERRIFDPHRAGQHYRSVDRHIFDTENRRNLKLTLAREIAAKNKNGRAKTTNLTYLANQLPEPSDVDMRSVSLQAGVPPDHAESIRPLKLPPPLQYPARHTFSQLWQDYFAASLSNCKRSGFFVELAANDATEHSNTFWLERELGWRGLCIEPLQKHWPQLLRKRPNCEVVGTLVTRQTGKEVFFNVEEDEEEGGTSAAARVMNVDYRRKAFAESYFGTADAETFDEAEYWRAKQYFQANKTRSTSTNSTSTSTSSLRSPVGGAAQTSPTGLSEIKRRLYQNVKKEISVSFADILEKFKAPRVIDFLSLDVEGSEWEVLQLFPFQTYLFLVISIEDPPWFLSQKLADMGYHYVRHLGWFQEQLFVHRSLLVAASERSADAKSYVDPERVWNLSRRSDLGALRQPSCVKDLMIAILEEQNQVVDDRAG